MEIAEKFRKPNGEKVLLENITAIDLNSASIIPFYYECPFLGRELWISPIGKLSPCCAPDNLRQKLGSFGNIYETTLAEVISSKKYRRLVNDYKKHELCKTCNMRKP